MDNITMRHGDALWHGDALFATLGCRRMRHGDALFATLGCRRM